MIYIYIYKGNTVVQCKWKTKWNYDTKARNHIGFDNT